MGSLFSALSSAATALQAFQRAVDVSNSNVTNANSPGYAKQVPVLQSLDLAGPVGAVGGVIEQTQDSRSQYADSAVRQQLSWLGQYQQLASSLAPLQNVVDVSASSPIPAALNQLFQNFSQWSTQPSSASNQSGVINAAQAVTTAFQQTAAQLGKIRSSTDQSLRNTIDQINQDVARIQGYNQAVSQQGAAGPGQAGQLESTLEDLSQLADVQVMPGVGGTVTVLLGGQTPLVIGTQVNPLQLENDTANALNGPPNVLITDSTGKDITSQVTSGGLLALLNVRNNLIPSLAGGGQQVGDLNTLAQSLADKVNNLLIQGSTTSTPPYQPGTPLFTYNPGNVAGSLQVVPGFTPNQLAATDTGPPAVSNGNAFKLAGMDTDPAGQINGLSFSQYFGTLAARVGNAVNTAQTNASVQTQLVAQVKSLQQQLSGVSLDEEAVRLVQLQSSYQAASKVVTIVDQMTQALLNMVQ